MTVCEGWFAGTKHSKAPTTGDLSPELLDNLRLNIAMNSKAFLVDSDTPGGRIGYVGSSTECALLLQLRGWGFEYNEVRSQHETEVLQARIVCVCACADVCWCVGGGLLVRHCWIVWRGGHTNIMPEFALGTPGCE